MAITDGFRQWATQLHLQAQGGQNAQLRVDLISDERAYALLFHAPYPYQGRHTEDILIRNFWTRLHQIRQGNPAPTNLRLQHVQIFTRFNPCLACTDLLLAFQAGLRAAVFHAHTAQYDIADRGNVYIPIENNAQIAVEDARNRKIYSISKLQLGGWTVETRWAQSDLPAA